MDDAEGLNAQDAAVYRTVLRAGSRPLAETAAECAGPPDGTGNIDKSVARLLDLGLLRIDGDEQLMAVSPMLAEATVLGGEDLELDARRAAVERRRDAIRRLIPDWNAALATGQREPDVDVVDEPGAIANVLRHFTHRCERELLSMAPGRRAASGGDGGTRTAGLYVAQRGISTRAIYQSAAARDRPTRVYLHELARAGAAVRLAATLPGRGLIVDRSVALLRIPSDAVGPSGLTIVRERSVVTWLVSAFELVWADAAQLSDLVGTPHETDPEVDATRLAILNLLAEGEKDEAIARRLSISVRTCRRHIADYMAQVGATSRFQAGVIAARADHTR
jgi:DNA-binding CsgD family transcriptional regulator